MRSWGRGIVMEFRPLEEALETSLFQDLFTSLSSMCGLNEKDPIDSNS